MSPLAKFHLMISTATIGTVYWILLHISTYSPPIDTLSPWKKAVVVYVTSPAVYKLLAASLRWILDRWRWSRQFFLGPTYLEGTWVGSYMTKAGEKLYSVEHFEQTLDGLTIRGQASSAATSTPRFKWTSKATSIDPNAGTLTFSYTCTDLAAIPPSPFEGIANFTFQRPNTKTAPNKIDGYSADLSDMTIYPNHEFLLTRKQMDLAEAWDQAKIKC